MYFAHPLFQIVKVKSVRHIVRCLLNIVLGIEPNPRPVFPPHQLLFAREQYLAPTLARAASSLAARPSSLPLPSALPSSWLCASTTQPGAVAASLAVAAPLRPASVAGRIIQQIPSVGVLCHQRRLFLRR
jgi:hypothetical protein